MEQLQLLLVPGRRRRAAGARAAAAAAPARLYEKMVHAAANVAELSSVGRSSFK